MTIQSITDPTQDQTELTSRIAAKLRAGSMPIVLTGGGGWLGQATLDFLDQIFGTELNRNVSVYGSHARALPLRSGRSIECQTLDILPSYAGSPPMLLHYACLTKDRVAGLGSQAFLDANEAIRETISAFLQNSGASGIFLPSSGAVYGPNRSTAPDPDQNPYGFAKMLDEARFAHLAQQIDAPLVIARVFNLAGPFINKPKSYVIADFIMAVIEGRDIDIRARSLVYRSYIHIQDLINLVLGTLLLSSSDKIVRFDTEGDETIEVETLAHRVASLIGHCDVRINRAAPDGGPDDAYIGDGIVMRTIADSFKMKLSNLDHQIRDTARYLKNE